MLLLWLLGCTGTERSVPSYTVELGVFEHTLSIPGELKAVRSVTINTPDLSGQIEVVSIIEEGTRVSEGDVLVEFDTTNLDQRLENSLASLEISRTKIEQKKAQFEVRLGDLQNSVTRAKLNLSRAEMRMTDSETVPRVERESARIDFEQSTIEVESSKATLQSARLEGEAELQLLQLDAEKASREVTKAREELERCVIRAEGEGLVILPEIWKGGSRGKVTVGDTVWSGSALITLPDLSEMEIEAWVHEVDAGLVAAEMPVSVVIDAYPDPPFNGEIERIADLAVRRERGSKVKHLKVTVSLEETSEFMKPGMTVRTEVLINRVEDVHCVPLESVFSDQEQQYVLSQALGGWRRQDVSLGQANDTHVIILEGVSDGDVIAMIDPDAEAGSAGNAE